MGILHSSDMNDDKRLSSITSASDKKSFFYVSQDNYYIADLDSSRNIAYYCDSATSCIIIIAVSGDKKKATISHLSRSGRFKKYFELVEKSFGDDKNVHIYAAGANPPEDETAQNNAKQVSEWISDMKNKGWTADISFGKGNPSVYENNLDCYGLHCDESGNITVNNDRIELTMSQRDPDNGLQTLFCVYGDKDTIREQTSKFSESEIDDLVEKARNDEKKRLDEAVDMSDYDILHHFSSTPDYEVPWFCESIRMAGIFVKNYKKGK